MLDRAASTPAGDSGRVRYREMAPEASITSQTLRQWGLIPERVRRALGMRRTVRAGDVRYRERTTEPLRHALSRTGTGFKEFDVVFQDGQTMAICCTPRRVYADLMGPRLLWAWRRVEARLRPGMRVLMLEGGTGYAAAWIAERLGPSGAVVSLDRDREAIEYARRRYRLPNVGFEIGHVEALHGEIDGAFDAVMAVDALLHVPERPGAVAECWRVVGPGGWLYLAAPLANRRSAAEPCRDNESLADIVARALGAAQHDPSAHAPVPWPMDHVQARGWEFVIVARSQES